jgi:tetratricopeptide (TPR) repeat protein
MLVTLPLVLLLLDIWPLQRARSAGDLLRLALAKTPLMIASAISCVLTIMAQHRGGAVRDLTHVNLDARLANAVVASGMYLWQTIWPANLAVFYPMPQDGWPAATLVLTLLALLTISVACAIAFVRGWRSPLIGWLWYLGTLVPVIGIVQVGAQARADRYTYFPLIGVFIMLAFAVPRVPAALQRVTSIAGAAVVFALASVTYVQVGYWRNSMTLAARALDVTRNNVVAHVILGNALIEHQRLEEGIQHLERARDIDPLAPQAWHNLAFAYDQAGRRDDAITACHRAIALRPELPENHYNLGLLLEAEGDVAGARAALQAALDAAARADDEVVEARAREALSRLPPSR